MKSKKNLSFIYSKPFLLVVSVIISISMWFFMAMSNMLERPTYVYDVPITVELSDEAIGQGLKIFDQNIETATVTISGDALVIGRVTASDVAVIATVSPSASDLSNMTLTTKSITLVGEKQGNVLANYDVNSVSPSEVSVTYDVYGEKKFTIDNNIQYTAETGYYVSSASMSDTEVFISGPQSEINKVKNVSLDLEIKNPISQSATVNSVINVYDQDGNVMDLSGTFLEISKESVDVNFTVQNKQTVILGVETSNVPDGFGDTRITIDPESIDIAGEESVVSAYETIMLPNVIDFSEINLSNTSFMMPIPMPANVFNISNVEFAKVNVNLSGYTEKSISTSQIEIINVPEDKDVALVTRAIQTLVVAPSAIGPSLGGNDVFVQVDMTNYSKVNGDVEVPVTVYIEGADSAWISGKYTVIVTVSDIQE